MVYLIVIALGQKKQFRRYSMQERFQFNMACDTNANARRAPSPRRSLPMIFATFLFRSDVCFQDAMDDRNSVPWGPV